MEFTFGYANPTTVEVTNRQQHVEYKILTSFADERDVRSAVGNAGRNQYAHYFDGFHFHRKPAIERMESDIEYLEKELAQLKFALKVTKKKIWVEVR
ncbi:MAG: hypothetical protein Unbinned5350contig1004_19 [Prokaryotic dsDNA virus sp.]|nr:MAG: hypothetical protein Unbinned5350contig1004_19 [Prokaryotic dsDNA virus sp.]|tara:strand:+ start:6506 stop:6796 length:291 start_codon:yes stop_codon:yes gene_type:complete